MLEALSNKNGFEFVALLENYEEDRLDEVASLLDKEGTSYFYAADVDANTNIVNFCNKFDSENLEEVQEILKKEAKIQKVVIILQNIERMISKENKTFVEFLGKMKEVNILFVMISKNSMATKDVIEKELNGLITKVIDNELTSIFDILHSKNIKPIDLFTYYSIFGVNQRYLKYVDITKTLRENLIALVLKKDSLFINEAESILKSELRTLQIYNMILMAVSRGAKTLSEISESLNFSTSICNKYTTVLINLGILTKIKPVYDNDTRKSEYVITNHMLDFIYHFVFENMDLVALGKEDKLYDEKIMPQMDRYLKNKFSLICREYIVKQIIDEKQNITLTENGKWWDKNNTIDIALGDSLKAIVGNCYWIDELVGKDKLNQLELAAENLDVADRKYYLFAKKGFSDELKKIAKKREDLELVDFNSIFEKDKKKFFLFK